MNAPDVTIVVCTYNRADRLPAALGSLGALQLGDTTAEILVVDNNSTDDTADVVAEIAHRSPIPMWRVTEPTQGIVPARNRGIAEARGTWIAFFDDDQLADPDWITQLLALAERRSARCVGGAVVLDLPDGVEVATLSPVVRMLLGETIGMDEERRYSQRVTPGCGNLLVRRDVFDEVGRFDPRRTDRGEDTDLWLRMRAAGIAGWYTPTAVVRHVIPTERLTAEYLLRLADRMSEGMADDECEEWGLRYPLIWLARLGQYLGVLWPRFLWAVVTRNHPRTLGTRCRLRIARRVLTDGVRRMFARPAPETPTLFETSQPRPTT